MLQLINHYFMRKYGFLIAAFLVLRIFAVAGTISIKGSFTGKILSATGKAIDGASIYITDIKVGTSSDINGNFLIGNIPEGKHLIEVSHIGYNTIAELVDIVGDTKKDFVLSEMVVENNNVVVTGVSSATTLKKIPFSVVTIRKQDIFQNTSTKLNRKYFKNWRCSNFSIRACNF
ncbi:MAG: carboxypeptidase-like regulatory domain-containing protein [Chitinophagaceae bacterium]|nr:carboxypeptidase-like regulatory domain-containing protein [Chitinophagaceae bacterium]